MIEMIAEIKPSTTDASAPDMLKIEGFKGLSKADIPRFQVSRNLHVSIRNRDSAEAILKYQGVLGDFRHFM